MIKPEKRYIVWTGGGEGYSPTEFDTIEEALIATKYSDDWYLTETVNYISATGYYRDPPKPKVETPAQPKP